MKLAHVLCLSLGLFAIAACGGSSVQETCEEGCDRTCAGDEPLTADEVAECKADCKRLADRVDTTDCGDQAEALSSCGEDYVCDPAVTSECADESAALQRCFADFCFDNPNNSACS